MLNWFCPNRRVQTPLAAISATPDRASNQSHPRRRSVLVPFMEAGFICPHRSGGLRRSVERPRFDCFGRLSAGGTCGQHLAKDLSSLTVATSSHLDRVPSSARIACVSRFGDDQEPFEVCDPGGMAPLPAATKGGEGTSRGGGGPLSDRGASCRGLTAPSARPRAAE